MGASFIIPSVFTAVDQMSPTVQRMRGNVIGFANSAESAFARVDRTVRRLTPGLGGVQKQLLSMVGTGAALAGGFQLGSFSFNSLANYEQAVDSFRVIVSDLNDADFSKFEKKIMSVARETKRGGGEVAAAFEKIAGINSKFAESADGLGLVTTASITLAKAARMDLGVAAENLVGIMNQFSFGADQANRTINALAAGQAVGAANITQTAEAFTVLGPVAAGANITLEESVGLIQTLGKFTLYGAEAGTKLRGVILRLQKAGLGYASGQFNINDALQQTNTILGKVTNAKQRDQLTNKLFGVENVSAGKTLLANIDTYKKFTQGVTGTTEAQKAAAINSGNLRTVIQQLGSAWENMLIDSERAGSGMNTISKAAQWLTRNLDTVVSTVVTATKIWLGYKAVMLTSQAIFAAWNVTLGISTALQGASSLAMKGNTVALAAQNVTMIVARTLGLGYATATEAATVSQWSLNAAMAANPVGFLVIGITALIAAVGYLIYNERQLTLEYERRSNLNIATHMSQELTTIDRLVDRYQKLGMNMHDATIAAIKFEQATINVSKIRLQTEIAALDKKIAEGTFTSTALGGAKFDLPGTGALRDQAIAKQQQLTGLNAESLALTNLAIGKTKQAPASPMFTSKDEFSGKELSGLFTQGPAATSNEVKNELKVTVENNSSGPVSVASGKTNLQQVQPGQKSTKIMDK